MFGLCVHVGVNPQVRLEWPTDLAINPLDNSLYILDNNIVLQVGNTPQHITNIFTGDELNICSPL